MLNKHLHNQLLENLGDIESLPENFRHFLKIVSNTYDDFEKQTSSSKDSYNASSSEMMELNSKLRNEAAELKTAHNELGRILNSVNHGFFSRDMIRNTYTYLSKGCENIYGYTVEEFFDNPKLWFNVIHPEDKSIIEHDDERLNNEEELFTQYRIIHKNNTIRWVEFKIIPYFKNGRLTRVDGVVNDITNRKQVEFERELMIKDLLKSNADLKQFSFITSHNLRAPLSNILGILNLLEYTSDADDKEKMLEMVKTSANQLSSTIDDLTKILIIKNNNNPQLTILNLEDAFKQVAASFQNTLEDINAVIQTEFNSSIISHNKVYIESIFVNLISNAIRYRSADKSLLITVKTYTDKNGDIVLTFTDNGSGIDLERHKDRIFGLYQRFHENIDGQGLGLFIMKSQIEANKGKIDIISKPSEGTTFIITFKNQLTMAEV